MHFRAFTRPLPRVRMQVILGVLLCFINTEEEEEEEEFIRIQRIL